MKKVFLGIACMIAMSLSVSVGAQDTKTKKEPAKTATCCKESAKTAACCKETKAGDKKKESCCAEATQKCPEAAAKEKAKKEPAKKSDKK
jgi:hypothetical protein